MKFAGNGATSLLEQLNNKIYSGTITRRYASAGLDKDMLVRFQNPRVIATFSKGMVTRVIKTEYKKVLRRFYSGKGVKRELAFVHKWKLLELNLIKDIKKAR
jgi:hypothetical protein